MKLIRLKIVNMASIPEAEINFDAAPLNSTDVFLISGDVGAGKSTILDCVCLALYNATPRIATAKEGGEINDISSLLRRGTGYSEVELEFEGNDRIRYVAHWSRQRARRKPDGKWQQVQWQLTVGAPGGKTLTKKEEVGPRIRQAVGLDYQDFCRTTLLAQGKFAAFLKGNDDSKAQILEKLTHTNIYTSISRKIFERASAAAAAVKDGEDEITRLDREILSDEVRGQITEQINRFKRRNAEIAKEEAELTAMKTWLENDAGLKAKTAAAASELEAATGAMKTPEFLARKADVEAWDRCVDARGEASRAREAEKKEAELAAKIGEVGGRVGDLRALRGAMAAQCDALTTEVAGLDARLGELAPMAAQLDAAESIASQIRANIITENKVADKSKLLADLETAAADARKPVEAATKELDDCNAAIRRLDEQITELQNDADFMALNDVNDRLTDILRRKADLEAARTELSRLDKAEADVAKDDADHQKALEEIRTLRAEAAALEQPREAARQKAEAAAFAFEQASLSVSEQVEVLRASLTPGCLCPVCRQKVAEAVPASEEIRRTIVRPLEEARDAAKTASTRLNEKFSAINANIKAKEDAAGKEAKRLAAQKKANGEGRAELLEKCGRLKVEPDAAVLAGAMAAVNDEETALNKAKDKGRKVQDEITRLGGERSKAEKLRDELTWKKDKATAKADKAARDYNDADTEVKTLRSELVRARAKVEELVGDLTFDGIESPHCEDYAATLSARRKERDSATENAENGRREIGELTRRSEELDAVLDELRGDNPEWFAADVAAADKVDKELLADSRRLHLSYTELRTSLRDSRTAAGEHRKNVAAYLEREKMDAREFERLCGLAPESVSGMRRIITDADSRLKVAQAAVNTLAAETKTHVDARPTRLTDGDTAEKLTEEIARLHDEKSDADRKLGALDQQILSNSRLVEKKAKLEIELSSKLAEKKNWDKLNALFGSADGKKFRTIAQSFVLENLIVKANDYMAKLMPRYRLSGEPGTYKINVEDSYDGFASRPANHISGGETFVVSLALALSLADIGTSLAVDTLFIDEGFGSLSGEPLEAAIETLRTLRNRGGRRVGIISHIAGLRESIPVQIQVKRQSGTNSSTITVLP